jgi:divalent metal cation (Fe/Co/Zn/Cd) transporter
VIAAIQIWIFEHCVGHNIHSIALQSDLISSSIDVVIERFEHGEERGTYSGET